MGRILKNYIYNSIYQIIAIIIPIITSPYLTRVLGAEQLGIEGYVTSVCQIFYTVGMIGLTNYATREIAYVRNDKYSRSKVFWEMNCTRITVFVLTLVVYFLVVHSSPYRIYFNNQYSPGSLPCFFDVILVLCRNGNIRYNRCAEFGSSGTNDHFHICVCKKRR